MNKTLIKILAGAISTVIPVAGTAGIKRFLLLRLNMHMYNHAVKDEAYSYYTHAMKQ